MVGENGRRPGRSVRIALPEPHEAPLEEGPRELRDDQSRGHRQHRHAQIGERRETRIAPENEPEADAEYGDVEEVRAVRDSSERSEPPRVQQTA